MVEQFVVSNVGVYAQIAEEAFEEMETLLSNGRRRRGGWERVDTYL